MNLFDGRPALRWAVPATITSFVVAIGLTAPWVASADAGLAPKTAQELLVAIQERPSVPFSGTVALSADLGIPPLPGSTGPLALAAGESTLRVWADGPTRQRIAVISESGERVAVHNGRDAWLWSSTEATATHVKLPRPEDGTAAELPSGLDIPQTPTEAAQLALAAIVPSTEVSTSGVAKVAGRDAYEIQLTPRDPKTLVSSVRLAVDAENYTPLRVQVFSTRLNDPALSVGFSSINFQTPDRSLFDFTPPTGAAVEDKSSFPWQHTGAKPQVFGSGWTTVLVGELPAEAAASQALLAALPIVEGPWGKGTIFSGTLFSAIVTDDGRYAFGAVGRDELGAALGAR